MDDVPPDLSQGVFKGASCNLLPRRVDEGVTIVPIDLKNSNGYELNDGSKLFKTSPDIF